MTEPWARYTPEDGLTKTIESEIHENDKDRHVMDIEVLDDRNKTYRLSYTSKALKIPGELQALPDGTKNSRGCELVMSFATAPKMWDAKQKPDKATFQVDSGVFSRFSQVFQESMPDLAKASEYPVQRSTKDAELFSEPTDRTKSPFTIKLWTRLTKERVETDLLKGSQDNVSVQFTLTADCRAVNKDDKDPD